ncbi:MAG: hypothetical protein AAF216_13980 [Pseudomonadota bacterium]
MSDDDNTKTDMIAASGLVSAAVLAALVGKLRSLDVLSDRDMRDVYEDALLLIEEQQAAELPGPVDAIYETARQIIEEQLRNVRPQD